MVPVQVTEHVYLARTCPACRRRCTPPAELDSVVLGQQRLGVNLLSLIATLREEGRLPIRSVQWYLDTVHHLRLSVGAIVSAIHQAQRAQPAVALLDRIRASPVVHADETGWREDGANGYVWTFSTPSRTLLPAAGSGQGGGGSGAERCFLRSIGQPISTPPTTIMTAPSSGAGPTCAGHPRPAHPLPQDAALARWAAAVHQLCGVSQPKPATITSQWQRRVAQLAPIERQLLAICRPFLSDPSIQGKLCRRMAQVKELFVFVAEPDVPADNNPAERSLRHLVIAARSAAAPARSGHREQDDAGIPLRHLARPRSKSSAAAVNCSFPRNLKLLPRYLKNHLLAVTEAPI